MRPFKKILIPTDFSDASRQAIAYGIELAAKFQAEAHLLHVVEENLYTDFSYAEGILKPVPVFNDLMNARQEMLDRAVDASRQEGREIDLQVGSGNLFSHLKSGYPASVIVELARELPADLVVIATQGRSGLAHLILGSVAERVVRECPCPVLTFRKAGAT